MINLEKIEHIPFQLDESLLDDRIDHELGIESLSLHSKKPRRWRLWLGAGCLSLGILGMSLNTYFERKDEQKYFVLAKTEELLIEQFSQLDVEKQKEIIEYIQTEFLPQTPRYQDFLKLRKATSHIQVIEGQSDDGNYYFDPLKKTIILPKVSLEYQLISYLIQSPHEFLEAHERIHAIQDESSIHHKFTSFLGLLSWKDGAEFDKNHAKKFGKFFPKYAQDSYDDKKKNFEELLENYTEARKNFGLIREMQAYYFFMGHSYESFWTMVNKMKKGEQAYLEFINPNNLESCQYVHNIMMEVIGLYPDIVEQSKFIGKYGLWDLFLNKALEVELYGKDRNSFAELGVARQNKLLRGMNTFGKQVREYVEQQVSSE
tara:strand:- start:3207 stop:4328 length:1122 start_codon:yes stop_codon:yes gene_type:complete